MSNPEIKFVVSTPCNLNNQPSGYRIIQLKNRKLSSLPIHSNKILPNNNNNNNITDIGITTQAFSYLKPYDKNILPESQNVGIMDYSDYMILSKSNGLIEIIKDYQYKICHNLPLVPQYVLACLPDGFTSHTTHSGVTIGLEFKDGLLYCCQSNGDIYVFILNLPAYYIQSNNLFDLNIQYQNTSDSTISNETYILQDSEDLQARQISDFFKETQYTGRTKLKHICYYLTPLQLDTTQSTKQNTLLHYITLYKDQYIYRPSICITLNHRISHFHINPFDRLSFVIGSQFDPIIIRKIVLPMTYLNYLITYLNLKKRVQEKYQMEIIPWEEVAMENGFHSFALWIAYESVYGYETVSKTLWDGIRNDGGTGYLQSIVVWRQGSDHSAGVPVGNGRYSDSLQQPSLTISSDSIVSRTNISPDNSISISRSRNRGRRWRRRRGRGRGRGRGRRDNFDLVRGNTIPRNGDTHRPEILRSLSNRRFNSFSKKLQVSTTLADFSVVDTSSLDNDTFREPFLFHNKSYPSNYDNDTVDSYSDALNIPSSPQSSSNSHHNDNDNNNNNHTVGTPFLTDKYKTMEILRIDKSLCFSVFKPKFQNNEVTKIDFFYNKNKMDNISTVSINNNNGEETDQEENIGRVILGKTLPNLSSFKKIFRLTKTLCLIVDNSGLLLIDLNNIGKGVHNLNDMKEIDCLLSKQNTTNNLPIRVSIFDIGLVNDAIVVMESFDLEPNRHIMRLNVITTCLPGDIKAFEVEFDSNHIMGYTVLQDCLRLTDVNRFTDKMALLDCNISTKFRNKRAFSDDLLSDHNGFKTKFDADSSVQDKRLKFNRRNSHP